MLGTELETIVTLSVQKEHIEVAYELISMKVGISVFFLIMALGIVYWDMNGKPFGLILALAAIVSMTGWIANCAVLAHAPDDYLRKAEAAMIEPDHEQRQIKLREIGGWNTYRQGLRYRTPIMIVSYLLAATIGWMTLLCFVLPHFPAKVAYAILFFLLSIGVVLVILAHTHASAR